MSDDTRTSTDPLGLGLFVLDGEAPVPCHDVLKWGAWYADAQNRQVAVTYLHNDEVLVSTVFLGIDGNYGRGEPRLFETMVFGGSMNHYQVRTATMADARRTHKNVCTMVEFHGLAQS